MSEMQEDEVNPVVGETPVALPRVSIGSTDASAWWDWEDDDQNLNYDFDVLRVVVQSEEESDEGEQSRS